MEKKKLESYIRVNHAGEFGAIRIYEGQIAALKNSSILPLLEEMKSQEAVHLRAFEEEIKNRKIRPTAFLPLWSVLGYGLGYISGKLGEKAAMACTQGVEEIIDGHYQEQLDELSVLEQSLKDKIKQFQQDEIHHKDVAMENGSSDSKSHRAFASIVRAATLFAIQVSKKI